MTDTKKRVLWTMVTAVLVAPTTVAQGDDDGCDDNWGEACPPTCDGGCTHDEAWWATHHVGTGDPWPGSGIEGVVRCGHTMLDLIQGTQTALPFELVRAYIAARLNAADGACLPDEIGDALELAHDLLGGCSLTAGERDAARATLELLDAYNGGQAGPGACDDCGSDDDEWDAYGSDDDECDDDD